MTAYLDSSVALRRLLGQTGALREWGAKIITSEITRVESLRTLDRLRLSGELDDAEVAEKMQDLREILERIHIIGVDRLILERASSAFPTVLGTLDAIHLASALLYVEQTKEKTVFLTHDARLATAAQAAGFQTLGA